MRRFGYVVAVCALALCLCCSPVLAQATVPPQPPSPMQSLLDSVPYDAAKEGPLLYVSASPSARISTPQGTVASLAQFARSLGYQVVPVGSLTVLAPQTMVVIEAHPGDPDPYAGLPAEDRFRVLLSLFTTDQWKLAGSARGIGAPDMNDQQRALFLGLLPERLVVQRTALAPTGEANVRRYENKGDSKEFGPADARLRLVRKVEFQFSKLGSEDYGYSSGVEPDLGEEHDILTMGGRARGDAPTDTGVITAFGQPVLRTVPSKFKAGQLDFTADVFHKPVLLDGEIKTLGDLLARTARVTGVELVADRRIAILPLFLRITSGQRAWAGDILKGLCWSVTGTFRRVGTSTYLLTDDVQGIGARFARLSEWAEAAESARYKAMEGLVDAAAKHDPLSYIGFAPGDPHALPPQLLQRVDAAYRKERYNPAPEMAPSDLPNALQKSLQNQIAYWAGTGVSLHTDRVRVGTQMSAQFVFPGGAAVEAPFSQNVSSQFLQAVAVPAREKQAAQPSANPPEPPKPMPDTLRKRVLVARLPAEDAELKELLATARFAGFTEVWLHVQLDEAKAPARLTTALSMADKSGLAVGAAVSLLHAGGMSGPEDINILGETGTEFAKRRTAGIPEEREYFGHVAGWTVLNLVDAVTRLAPMAGVPGLSALVLMATAAPGWAGDVRGGDGIPTNGHLGYGVGTRLACIRREGLDPIDVTPYSYSLKINESLPFFPSPAIDGPWSVLSDFRLRLNRADMATIYTTLRRSAPDLPLYLDDRASAYADPNTRWYGRWDVAERIPVNPVFAVESEAREAAFASSPEPLLCRYVRNATPETVARSFGETARNAAEHWRGVVLDLSDLTFDRALRILAALPKTASSSR